MIAAELEAAVISAREAEDEAISNRDGAKLEASMLSYAAAGNPSGT